MKQRLPITDSIRKIYNFIFNKKKQKVMQEEKQQIVLTAYSQPHVLQQRMKEERLTHGDRVTANLSPVRLESNFGKMIMYFCPMVSIDVIEKIATGDGRSLPAEAIIDGLEIPKSMKPGLYELKNVELFSNGTLQVIAKAKTEFIPV